MKYEIGSTCVFTVQQLGAACIQSDIKHIWQRYRKESDPMQIQFYWLSCEFQTKSWPWGSGIQIGARKYFIASPHKCRGTCMSGCVCVWVCVCVCVCVSMVMGSRGWRSQPLSPLHSNQDGHVNNVVHTWAWGNWRMLYVYYIRADVASGELLGQFIWLPASECV